MCLRLKSLAIGDQQYCLESEMNAIKTETAANNKGELFEIEIEKSKDGCTWNQQTCDQDQN